jgi:adenine-specific DNA-methyltransferase
VRASSGPSRSFRSFVPVSAPSRQKHFGAFYTPEAMAAVLVDWAVRERTDTVLDPSFGGLVFLGEADRRLRALGAERPERQLYGSDLDEQAFTEAADVAGHGATLVHRDFLRIAPGGRLLPRVSAVVGNPPYVRYQTFREGREHGRVIAARHGVHLTRLASSWAPLLIHAADFVAPGGRLAQVLPAELIHAQYAEQVLGCICAGFSRVIVAMFDEHVFPGAQEEVVLLFAEGRDDGPAPGVEVISSANLSDLQIPDAPGAAMHVSPEQKLLAGLLDPAAVATYDRLRTSDLTRLLGELASVDIGAVTGANDFFVRSASELAHVPQDWLRPAISKAAHVPGARLSQSDVAAMDERGLPARLLVIEPKAYAHTRVVAELIAQGERAGVHERYKCRIRSPWWSLPDSQVASPPHLFLTYMASEVPRLAVNEAQALSTNTVHGVRLQNGTDPACLAASFYSSLTMLSAELVGRSYGGGVLKLEPTEAERLVLPRPSARHGRLLNAVDDSLRARRYDELQAAVDQAVLVEDLGVSAEDVAALRGAVARLRGRRRARATYRAR